MRFDRTVEFESEVLAINALLPMAAASVCCFVYFLLTRDPPNKWVVGVACNVCWIASLRETMLSSYLQGQSDAVRQSPYLKPHIQNQIPPQVQQTKLQQNL